MDKFEQHIKRMRGLREVYEAGTGQHNILSILINECEEALLQPPVIGSLPLDLVKVIASKSYRQGCFHLDDMDAGMRQFEKWYESEIKELRSSGK